MTRRQGRTSRPSRLLHRVSGADHPCSHQNCQLMVKSAHSDGATGPAQLGQIVRRHSVSQPKLRFPIDTEGSTQHRASSACDSLWRWSWAHHTELVWEAEHDQHCSIAATHADHLARFLPGRRHSSDSTGWGQRHSRVRRSNESLTSISDCEQGYTVLPIAHTGGGS